MSNGILGIGLSALNAAQRGLLVAGHNVSNASTPGYTRQQSIQSTNQAQATGSGFIGQGVQLDSVKRSYNQFLANNVVQAQTESSQLAGVFWQRAGRRQLPNRNLFTAIPAVQCGSIGAAIPIHEYPAR